MVVILGAGIVGASTAYFLAKEYPSLLSDYGITVIDGVGPATGSSGKAGAFVAQNSWKSSKVQVLHEKAFELHEQLADELLLDSFSELTGQFVQINGNEAGKNDDDNYELDIEKKMLRYSSKPIPGRCAQVDPAELTHKLLNAAIELGATLEIDTVDGMSRASTEDESKSGSSVACIQLASGRTLSVEDQNIVVALGPWSCRLEDWLGIPTPLDGVLSTSMLWNNECFNHNENAALFCEEDSNGCHLEVIPRPFEKSIYVSGCGGSTVFNPAILRGPNRPIPGEEEPDTSRVESVCQSLLDLGILQDHNGPNEIRACIRPNSPDAMPLVGQVLDNCYVATGGGAWGITYGPLMGQSMARMIMEDTDNLAIRSSLWTPRRFDTMLYRSLMKQRGREARG